MKGILLFGTRTESALPAEAREREMIAAFCLTESGAGSDALDSYPSGQERGRQWILNGERFGYNGGMRICIRIRTHLIGGGQDHASWSRRRGPA